MNTLTKQILNEADKCDTITEILNKVNKVNKNTKCTYYKVNRVLKVYNKLDKMIKHKNRHKGRRKKPSDMSSKDQAFCVRWSKIIWALKQGGGKCVKCGHTDPRHLVYHHRDGVKTKGIVRMVQEKAYTKEDVLDEIKNCDLLCCHCHKNEHIDTDRLTKYSNYIRELTTFVYKP